MKTYQNIYILLKNYSLLNNDKQIIYHLVPLSTSKNQKFPYNKHNDDFNKSLKNHS